MDQEAATAQPSAGVFYKLDDSSVIGGSCTGAGAGDEPGRAVRQRPS
jgi:hypothetical protein